METPQGEVLDSLVDKLFFCIALLFLYHLGQLGIVGMSIAIMREFAGLAVDFWRFIGKRERARLGWDPPWAKWLGFLLPMAIVVNLLLLAVSPLAGVPEYMWWLGSLVLNFGIFARVSTVIFYLVRDRRLLRTLGFL
jgi:phosphatidylglycerophosphate synthase